MEETLSTQGVSKCLSEIRVPFGHIIVNGRWRGTELLSHLQGSSIVHIDDDLGIVDFHPSAHMGVIYISEPDIIAGTGYRRKVAKLRKANKVRGIVLAENTTMSSQYYQDLQKFCMLEIGFVLLPVADQLQAAKFLTQLVKSESSVESNPFLKTPKRVSFDTALLATLQCIPRLGEVKAKQLLQHFPSLRSIASASIDDLSEVIGKATAKSVNDFLSP